VSRFVSLRILALVSTAVAAGILPVGPASAQKPPVPEQSQRPVKADVDRNKIFDDFEGELAGKADDARVDVIVALRGAATEERVRGIEARVGTMCQGSTAAASRWR